jgi:hypothetical protein
MEYYKLFCDDGVLCAALAEHTHDGWVLYGVSKIYGFGEAEYKKRLFDETFDDIVPFNSMSGVSYIMVRKDNLWGLIRMRDNGGGYEGMFDDFKATELLEREIMLVEPIKYPDFKEFTDKYELDTSMLGRKKKKHL